MNPRIRGRISQRRGAAGQSHVAWHLYQLGFKCQQEIATPVVTKRVGKMRVIVGYRAKVCGDFHAVGPCGRSVLVEVKTIDEPKLSRGELDPHQWRHLYDHAQAGGLSLIAWVKRSEPMHSNCAIFPFDAAPGWGVGSPLPWDVAWKIRLTRDGIPDPDWKIVR